MQSVFVDSNVTDVTTRKHTVDGLLAASTYTVKVVANLQTETDQSFATKAETLQGELINLSLFYTSLIFTDKRIKKFPPDIFLIE